MGIMEDVFQMEGKENKDLERLKMGRKKSMPARERCFSMEKATLFGPVAMIEEEVRGSRKKFSGRKRRAKGQVRLLGVPGSAELGQVVSGSAM